MIVKKIALYCLAAGCGLIPPVASFQVTASPELENLFQALTHSVKQVTPALNSFISSYQCPSALTVLALCTGYMAADQLVRRYPAQEPHKRTHADWLVPAAALTASTATLAYLWSLNHRR